MALQSPFALLLKSLIDKIKADVPEVRYINQDLGQLEEARPPVTYPCVLIDMDEFEFSDMGNEPKQLADGFVAIRLALPTYSNSSNLTPSNVFEKAMDFYEIEYKLFTALHNWQPTGFGRLLRRRALTEKRDDNMRVRVIPFAINFTDDGAKKTYTVRATPPPTIGKDIPTLPN